MRTIPAILQAIIDGEQGIDISEPFQAGQKRGPFGIEAFLPKKKTALELAALRQELSEHSDWIPFARFMNSSLHAMESVTIGEDARYLMNQWPHFLDWRVKIETDACERELKRWK